VPSRGRRAASGHWRFTAGIARPVFVAWYGTEEDADTETIEVEKCGLCGGEAYKKDNFKDCVLRLMAQVTARGVKRGD
jgi:tRNA U54 and U55 pseudouridine synthase Pus10